VRFQVLIAANVKIAAVWDIVLCSLAEEEQSSIGAYCLHNQGDKSPTALMMETVDTFE
jgi:hypothetical protein